MRVQFLEEARNALTAVSQCADASTCKSGLELEALVDSYVDKCGYWRLGLQDLMNISQRGQTPSDMTADEHVHNSTSACAGASTGLRLADEHERLNVRAGLSDDIDQLCTDGAKNVCAETGPKSSMGARWLEKKKTQCQCGSCIWCHAHFQPLPRRFHQVSDHGFPAFCFSTSVR